MTTESLIYTALSSLVAGRVFPDLAPNGTPLPYITYGQVGGAPVNFMDSATVPSQSNSRFQIDVWSESRLQCALIAKLSEQALRGTVTLQTTVLGSPVAAYEPDTQLYGSRQDFSFWN